MTHISPVRETIGTVPTHRLCTRTREKLGPGGRKPMLYLALSLSQGIHWGLLALDNVIRSKAAWRIYVAV